MTNVFVCEGLANQLQIFVHSRPAQFAYFRQLADVHFLGSVGWVVLIEDCRDVLFGRWFALCFDAFCFGILHIGTNPISYHLQL